jgi:serine-type D-Ala-D-Ala carboxypeptidase/endopeptidase
MKRTLSFFLTCFFFAAQFIHAQEKTSAINWDSLTRQLGEKFMKMTEAVGLSLGIYYDEQDRFYNFGYVEKGQGVSPNENTLYEIGSVAKTFTSFLLAKAVLEKKISLDDDIRKYLDDSFPNLEYQGQPVRILHLANATSGLPDWLPPAPEVIKNAAPDSVSFLRERIYAGYTRKDFYEALKEVKLDTVPGSIRKHSNAGGDLLTYILEAVYKKPYRQLVEQYIFKSIKMGNSAFAGASSKGLANGYNGKGLGMPYSAGAFISTTADLLKYIKLHLAGENKYARLALIKTANLDPGSNKVVQRDTNVYHTALNWFSYKNSNGITQIWYDGGTHGFMSYVIFYPELKTAIVLLANAADEKIYRALRGIAYEIFKVIEQSSAK